MGSMPQTARLLERLAMEREACMQESSMMHAALGQARGLVTELRDQGHREQARAVEASIDAVGQAVGAARGPASMMARLPDE